MITAFTGKYRFLSNFTWCKVFLDGQEYPSVEHAYQAAKTLDPAKRIAFQSQGMPPSKAKELGNQLELRSNWSMLKYSIMESLVRQKFQQQPFKQLLLDTYPNAIVEGNWWHDNFWGECRSTCKKCTRVPRYNNLGILLEGVRRELGENL